MEEYEKQRQREEKRKHKHLKKIREQEQQQLSSKIRSEEKKLLIAQRKLESIRILEALFERIKVSPFHAPALFAQKLLLIEWYPLLFSQSIVEERDAESKDQKRVEV